MRPGDRVGQRQFIGGGARGANVVALSDCILLRVPVTVLDGIPAKATRTLSASDSVRRRWLRSKLAFVLPNVFSIISIILD